MMATRLTRAVVRELAACDQRTGRPFIIRLEEGGKLIRLRPKGTRRWYTVTVAQVWVLAAKNRADEIHEERAARRAARKLERS